MKIKPYYQDDSATVYCGDCIEVMQSFHRNRPRIDITVSSPPYNQLQHTASGGGMHEGNRWVEKSKGGYRSFNDNMTEDEYAAWVQTVFWCCRDLSEGVVWINHKCRFRNGFALHPLRMFDWPLFSEIIWDRGGSMVLNAKRFAPSHEVILGFGKPHFWDDAYNTRMSVWRMAPKTHDEHPCPFPDELVSPLIAASCPPDGVVLDPFGGTGTVARVAKDLGRKSIIIEIDERYCELIAQNLAQETLNL